MVGEFSVLEGADRLRAIKEEIGGREGRSLEVSTSSISTEEVSEAMEVAFARLGSGGEERQDSGFGFATGEEGGGVVDRAGGTEEDEERMEGEDVECKDLVVFFW